MSENFEHKLSVEEIRLERKRLEEKRKTILDALQTLQKEESELHNNCPHDKMLCNESLVDDPIWYCPDCGLVI